MASSISSLVLLASLTTAEGGSHTSCACKYQGMHLPDSVVNNYPQAEPAGCTGAACTKTPGQYRSLDLIKLYGTTCAAWDNLPGTPWKGSCPDNADFGHKDFNWCQVPWCYVDPSCPSAEQSSVFTGSDASHFSYAACGSAPNCYTGVANVAGAAWPAGCPYDPHGKGKYTTHGTDHCACKYSGMNIPASIYTGFPERSPAGCTGSACTKTPGMYQNLASVKAYGTVCAAWDQMPGTPWFSSCPGNADFCHQDKNWCQIPWCYVDSRCSSAQASSVFAGSEASHFSYNTCLNSPDCYTNSTPSSKWVDLPSSCPFDKSDNGWYTKQMCPNGWTGTTTTAANQASSASSCSVAALAAGVAVVAMGA